jgi:hypothetical protein
LVGECSYQQNNISLHAKGGGDMRKGAMMIGVLAMAGCILVGGAVPVYAADLGLVGLLTSKLGVTNEQAESGAGAIFSTASKKMSVEDFTKVTDALPEVTSLMSSFSSGDSGSGSLGGLSSMMGKTGSSLSTLAGLSDTFSKLGIGSDMVGKFIPIVLEYAQSKGGSTIANLLKSALQ